MKRLKKLIVEWFGFSGAEVNGVLILLPLIVILLISEPLYRRLLDEKNTDFAREYAILDSLTASWNDSLQHVPAKPSTPVENTTSLFPFNPNKATETQLLSLGFSKHLSTRIVNYRQKGGLFRIKRDLMKMYGMDSTLYDQLYDWIQLPEDVAKPDAKAQSTQKKFEVAEKFDINKADTARLKAINGIGEKRAARIIKFRDALGGFTNASQFAEIYGMDSIVVVTLASACFIEQNFQPRRINLNATDEKTLTAHPYISKTWAKAIVAYRFQHGDFTDVRDLLKIQSIPPQQAERIVPYLKVKD